MDIFDADETVEDVDGVCFFRLSFCTGVDKLAPEGGMGELTVNFGAGDTFLDRRLGLRAWARD